LAAVALIAGVARPVIAQPAGPTPPTTAPTTDDDSARAAKLYDEGKRHFDIGEYVQAIATWKQAYLLSNASLLLFNIGQAYRLSNNCAQANRFYLNYKRVEPHPKNQGELDKAQAKCAGVEPATGEPTEPTTTPVVTPTTATTTPVTTTMPPTDATTSTTVTAPPVTTTTTTPPVTGTAPMPPQPPPDANAGSGWRIAGVITGVVGVVFLGGSIVYAAKASSDASTLNGYAKGTVYAGAPATTDSNGASAAKSAKGLLGLGLITGLVGGGLWYYGHRQGETHVDVAITPSYSGIGLSCAF
jgi:hypothetical protein